MGSSKAYEVTKLAAGMTTLATDIQKNMKEPAWVVPGMGLTASKLRSTYALSFSRCDQYFRDYPLTKALVVQFKVKDSSHAVAFFRESPDHILFYDANAGSYRVQAAGLGAFLTEYNDVCLRLKWPGDCTAPATTYFSNAFLVASASS